MKIIKKDNFIFYKGYYGFITKVEKHLFQIYWCHKLFTINKNVNDFKQATLYTDIFKE